MVMRYCLLLLRAGRRKAAAEAYQWGFDMTEQRLASHGARDLFDLKPTSRSADLKELRAAAHTVIGLTNLEARTWDEHRMPPDVAIAEYRKALAVKPDFDIARIFLGKAYKKKEFLEPGSGQLAAEAWRAAERSSNDVVRAKARELLGKP